MEITFGQWEKMALCMADAIKERGCVSHMPILVYLPKSVMTLVSFAGCCIVAISIHLLM